MYRKSKERNKIWKRRDKRKACQNTRMSDETHSVQTKRKLIMEDVSQLMQSVDKHMDFGRARAEDCSCYKPMSFKTANKYMELEVIQINDRPEELKQKIERCYIIKKIILTN